MASNRCWGYRCSGYRGLFIYIVETSRSYLENVFVTVVKWHAVHNARESGTHVQKAHKYNLKQYTNIYLIYK